MRVLISAYACEPGKGSEQGTGWNLVLRLAERHDVTVVTRANNQEVIEADLADRKGLSLSFIYHDLGARVLRLKKKKIISVQLYYTLWLLTLNRRLYDEADLESFDLVHHLTFNTFEIPPLFLRKVNALKVWGPVGGGQIAPANLTAALSAKALWKERFRGWRVRTSGWNPIIKATLLQCDLVLFANEETRDLLKEACQGSTGTMVDVGVDTNKFQKGQGGSGDQILFAGNFEHRKGARLVLWAFQQALQKRSSLRLKMLGDGPEWELEKEWVKAQGLEDSIDIPGRCTHAEMAEAFAKADIFVFPSLRDTSGSIVLEAMASEVPTVCLNHQGARLMVDDASGIRVPVLSKEETIRGMADAFVTLADDQELRQSMGKHARERVIQNFGWESKATRLLKEYQQLAEQS